MKLAVLVSGGMDSTVAYRLGVTKYGIDNVAPVFVNYDQPYFEKEQWALIELENDGVVPNIRMFGADLCDERLDNVPTVDKQEIYGRNLLVSFYGAILSGRVWLSCLENEMQWPTRNTVPDKSHDFLLAASTLYTIIFKNKRLRTIVESPFANMTKSDVIEMGLSLGLTQDQLLKTVSCYEPQVSPGSPMHCGKCMPCVKRFIAWINNDFSLEKVWADFAVSPLHSPVMHDIVERMRNKDPHYTKKRYQETEAMFRKLGKEGMLS